MPKVRTLLLMTFCGLVLAVAIRRAAADDVRFEPLWDSSALNATHLPSLAGEPDSGGQVEAETDGNRPEGFEQSLPPGHESVPLSGADSTFPGAGDEVEGIIELSDTHIRAYTFGYNPVRNATTWLPGGNDRFGWLSFESLGGMVIDDMPSLVTGFGFHLLDGPVQTEMPPRLFDFSIGVADRREIQPNIAYDVLFRIGAFSDFEGSAKDGVRYPSHAVAFLRLNPSNQFVLGIDYLDWDDLQLLPVAGVIWTPLDWVKVEAVFPRPRVAARICETSTWVYVGGELDGGTWAIERDNSIDDNATYRDLRLVLGWETLLADGLSSRFEIGYVFDRRLSYSSGGGNFDPPDGFMVRMGGQY